MKESGAVVAVCGVASPSLTCAVNVKRPEVVGAPLSRPVADSVTPLGSAPLETDHV